MKTTMGCLIVALMLSAITVKAQNGGQSAESGSLRLEYVGTSTSSQAIIKITNKQTCEVDVKIRHNNQIMYRVLPSLGSDTIHITTPECEVEAKPLTVCSCTCSSDMGWVELNICDIVPIKFEWITTKQIDAHTIEVRFKPTEVSGKMFYIQYSENGQDFKRLMVVPSEEIKVGKIYSVIVKI